ncbi:MAG: AzlD domain-containing protein [Alkalibacterium sp.]|uniref:AzlD domain-containing protein n=1 Tax=Alkalibacterium sp. TaxID=1872447 RepID=UPI003970B09C
MTSQIGLLILGMAIVTYIPRFLPILLLSKKEISPSFSRWMSYIPVSIFASLIASDIFFWEGSFSLQPLSNIKLIPSVLVLIVAYKTKSLLWSMITGVLAMTLFWML